MADQSVAIRYAEALYSAAKEAGLLDLVLADLAGTKVALESDTGLVSRLFHPRISPEVKVDSLVSGPLRGRHDLVRNTLVLMVRNGRAEELKEFFRTYLDVHEARSGILRVEVSSASALSAETAEAIRQRVAEATGQPVVLEARVVPELLGGLRFLIGSRLIDGSIKSRLDRIARGLREAPVAKA
jgi:F-type H+-transporting ATPase subunit delta